MKLCDGNSFSLYVYEIMYNKILKITQLKKYVLNFEKIKLYIQKFNNETLQHKSIKVFPRENMKKEFFS